MNEKLPTVLPSRLLLSPPVEEAEETRRRNNSAVLSDARISTRRCRRRGNLYGRVTESGPSRQGRDSRATTTGRHNTQARSTSTGPDSCVSSNRDSRVSCQGHDLECARGLASPRGQDRPPVVVPMRAPRVPRLTRCI